MHSRFEPDERNFLESFNLILEKYDRELPLLLHSCVRSVARIFQKYRNWKQREKNTISFLFSFAKKQFYNSVRRRSAYYQNCFLALEVNICFPILFVNFRNLSCFILLFIRAPLFGLSIIITNVHLSMFYGFIHFIRKHVSIWWTIKQILHDFKGAIMAIFISPRKVLEKPYIFLFHVPVAIV